MNRRGAKNKKLVSALTLVVIGMGGLAYASVPLYQLFCQITGYGGTPKIVTEQSVPSADAQVVDVNAGTIKVRFDANMSKKLPWKFTVKQNQSTVRVGEQNLAFYEVTNLSDKPITGRATYNVTPYKVGPYFSKIACFCFDEQTVQPGETVSMPVQYSVDPEILKDLNTKEVKTITLSYTFFKVENPTAQENANDKISQLNKNNTTKKKIL